MSWRSLPVSPEHSTTNCGFRGKGDKPYQIEGLGGNWGKPQLLGGLFISPARCISRSEKDVECFMIGFGNVLYHEWKKQGQWTSHYALAKEHTVKGRPSATTWGEDRMVVFVLSMDNNEVLHKFWDGSEWRDTDLLGGSFESVPECVTTRVNSIHCFAVGEKSYLYTNSYNGKEWTGWEKSFGFFLENPSCVVSNTNEISCYLRRFNKEVVQIVYKVV